MKRAILSLGLLAVTTIPQAHAILHGEPTTAYSAVVKIEASGYIKERSGKLRPDSFLCSGTKVSDHLILTSAHCLCDLVVKRSDPMMRTFFEIPTHDEQYYLKINDQKMTGAELGFFPGSFGTHCREQFFSSFLSVGYYNDLAFIKISKTDQAKLPRETIEIGSDPARIGDAIEIVGYGTTQVTLSKNAGEEPSYDHWGTRMAGRNVISSLGRDTVDVQGRLFGSRRDAMVEEATVLPGDSGGPLLRNGKLIGVASGQAWMNLDRPKKVVNESGYASALSDFFKDTFEASRAKAESSAAE